MSSGAPEHLGGSAGGSSPGAHDVPNHLQRLDRLANLGLFSAGIAHEIKNGLVAINTFCQVLLEKEDSREMAGMVRRELKRIDGLATQMLRLAAPKPALLTPVNTQEVLDYTLGFLEHQLADRNITLRRDYRAASPMVQADESLLQQAFLNLLMNAMEAMGQRGELTVATETRGSCLRIAIGDTGMGVAPENFGHIFDTFFTTKKHGTGLGLAITRRVIEEHHGTIEVQSQVGFGSTFTIVLPAG
jgi:signal transduction histidine kinase